MVEQKNEHDAKSVGVDATARPTSEIPGNEQVAAQCVREERIIEAIQRDSSHVEAPAEEAQLSKFRRDDASASFDDRSVTEQRSKEISRGATMRAAPSGGIRHMTEAQVKTEMNRQAMDLVKIYAVNRAGFAGG